MAYQIYKTSECPKEIARSYSCFQLSHFKYIVVWGYEAKLFVEEPKLEEIQEWMDECKRFSAEVAAAKAEKMAKHKAKEERRKSILLDPPWEKGDDSFLGRID